MNLDEIRKSLAPTGTLRAALTKAKQDVSVAAP